MGIKQDYILKIVEQILEILLEKVYGTKNKNELSQSISKSLQDNYKFEELKKLIENKKINLAENKLFEYLEEKNDENFKLALLFYNYLNSKTDEFLKENYFSREEIKEGIKDVCELFGYEHLINIYLM